MKNAASSTGEANRAASVSYFDQNSVRLPGNDLGDRRESNAIFITKRQVSKQVCNGKNSTLFQQSSTVRSDAAQVFHRIGEGDTHEGESCKRQALVRRSATHVYIIAHTKNTESKTERGRGCRWSGGNPFFGREGRFT